MTEFIGYAGTALILLSMVMTSVTWLRWLNLAGSVFSMTYGLLTDTMPTFWLNICLVLINGIQLLRIYRKKEVQT